MQNKLLSDFLKKSDISDVLESTLAGRRLNLNDCIRLVKSDDAYSMGLVANVLRQRLFGNTITFINNII
ncbi:MAG TPA: dehypoxanthine futalosine cyclase, partial [Nitrososphaera sp.]|nr:dehypoxanthine futalosine cyclase [Nitrososphaera sp.]